MDVDGAVAALASSMPEDEALPLALARAVAALRSGGVDVTDKARAVLRSLPSMRAYALLLMTDEERIDDLYGHLRRTCSTSEQEQLLRELRALQEAEASRLVAEAESRTRFQPREAQAAIAEARRLATRHAAASDHKTTKQGD